jgi:hypothetical protein
LSADAPSIVVFELVTCERDLSRIDHRVDVVNDVVTELENDDGHELTVSESEGAWVPVDGLGDKRGTGRGTEVDEQVARNDPVAVKRPTRGSRRPQVDIADHVGVE